MVAAGRSLADPLVLFGATVDGWIVGGSQRLHVGSLTVGLRDGYGIPGGETSRPRV